MRSGLLIVAAIGCMIPACDKPEDARAKAQKAATAVSVAGGPPGANPQCKLFSQKEVGTYIGEPVLAGEDVAGGCQWRAKDGSGDVIVAVVPAANHESPRASEGYQATLAAPGSDGFTAPYLGGWIAGAIVGEEALRVSLDGQTASRAGAAALLRDAAKRWPS